jgi:hypothetical protein
MATTTFEVTAYDVELARQADLQTACRAYAIISCHGTDGKTLILCFLHPDSPVPDNHYDPSRGIGSSYLPAVQYPWYLDILRNEKPVFARMHSEKPHWNKVFTGAEPVGEGELA